jgi:hypothetical protein
VIAQFHEKVRQVIGADATLPTSDRERLGTENALLGGGGDGEPVFRQGVQIESVTLTWGQSPRDLDLHLTVDAESDVQRMYHASQHVKGVGALKTNCRSGYGPETISLIGDLKGIHHFSVYWYSQSGDLKESNAEVRIDADGRSMTIRCPTRGEGQW